MKQTLALPLILMFALLSALSYAQEYTTDSNTVALWHFNEGSGSLAADETSRFNGSVSGVAWTTGKHGSALSFNGATNSVTISSNTTEGITNQMTAEAWIYPTKSDGRIVGRYGSTSGNYYSLSYLLTLQYGSKLALYINSPSFSSAGWSTSTIPLNTWTHVAATYDGSTVKLYINGNLDSTTNLNLGNIRENSAPIMIGNDGYSDVAFGGIIDEVRISNTARTEFNVQHENQTEPNLTDTTLPIITITNPQNNSVITTNSTILQVTTNENAVCKSSLCFSFIGTNTGTAGCTNIMNMSITGGISHSQILTNLNNNYTYTVNVNCTNPSNNSNASSVTFFVNLSASSSGGGGCGCTSWSNVGCGASPCNSFSSNQLSQIRTCNPSGCADEYQCVFDSSCPICPACHSPSSWSDCTSGNQTRTNYGCGGASTNYQCQSYIETQSCNVTSTPINLTCSLDSDCTNKLSCLSNETSKCVSNTCQCVSKPVDKTVLLGILIQIETMKTSFMSLNNSAAGLLDYYTSINDIPNIEKWTNVTALFGDAIGGINDMKTYINTVKDAPTQSDIAVIKNKIGGVLAIVDKIVEAILGG